VPGYCSTAAWKAACPIMMRLAPEISDEMHDRWTEIGDDIHEPGTYTLVFPGHKVRAIMRRSGLRAGTIRDYLVQNDRGICSAKPQESGVSWPEQSRLRN
jgi:hypothetical protein